MVKFIRHPFEFPPHVSVFYVENMPIDLLNSSIEKTSYDEKIQELIEDIRKHGMHAPLILEVSKDNKIKVILGNKRLFAAKALGYLHIRSIITIQCNINDLTPELKSLFQGARRLWNSDNVIKVFGFPIDLQHLCIDESGQLTCVGNDHHNWITSKDGAIPENWCR